LKKQKFYYFVSKKAFNIEGLGPQIIEKFLEEGLISSYDDLFTLEEGDIMTLDGFKEKSSKNIIDSIKKSREISLARLLVSLSIDQIGEETAYEISEHFRSVEKIQNASVSDLKEISGVGDVVAESLYSWFRNSDNKKMLSRLLKQIKIKEGLKKEKGKFFGKTFVFTGSLISLTRDEAQEKVRAFGGSISSSVSKNVDYVVVGNDPGTKYNRAKELGVVIISEKELIALINS
jgi:DNA ligase (NAD+)